MRAAVRYPVVIGGLVTLGLQVLAPRILHPFFGSGTATAAAIVAAALAGLAAGYRWGGRSASRPGRLMAATLLAAALYLIVLGLVLRLGLLDDVVLGQQWLVPMAVLLAGVPSLLLGTVSPLAIQALGDGHGGRDPTSATDDNIVAEYNTSTEHNTATAGIRFRARHSRQRDRRSGGRVLPGAVRRYLP